MTCSIFPTMSASMRLHALAMQALTEPSDFELPSAMISLIDAIDRVDLAYQANHTSPVAAPAMPALTISGYLKTQREIAGCTVHDLALRLQTDPSLPFADRVEWITSIEAGLTPISIKNATSFLNAVRLDIAEVGLLLQLIRDQEHRKSATSGAPVGTSIGGRPAAQLA